MLQEKALSESDVHLYIDMKHTEIVRPVLHAVKQAVDRWGWTADRLVVATFRQLDLLQASKTTNLWRYGLLEANVSRLRTRTMLCFCNVGVLFMISGRGSVYCYCKVFYVLLTTNRVDPEMNRTLHAPFRLPARLAAVVIAGKHQTRHVFRPRQPHACIPPSEPTGERV